MPLTPSTRLGTYEILAPLGAGGMGEVYRARDTRLGRDVALKVLPSDVAADAARLARFEREARTVAGLNHPNIVTLFSVEDEAGIRFITMELVEGQTLGDVVTPGGLTLPRLLDLAIPLADALVAAHERGVIHRDLKPGNVMVTREGRVKVLDFGLAKAAGDAPARDVTLSDAGQALGTVPYMAPEQLRGEVVDARSDLFALGIVLYELATGRRPFRGDSSVEVSSAILRDTPEPLAHVRADLPGDLERIVSRCLEKNPRERAQSALDVSNDLRRLRKAPDGQAPAQPAAEKVATIAVLPFVNRSASADDEYFSDGLADELLGMLSKIQGLRVIARSSSFVFKGKQASIAEIGKALDVATVLEGSVRKSGNRARISVQLVKVADSTHLWSETYDRTLDDIFAVQDDVAQSVVKELRTTLLGEAADSDASGQAKAAVVQAQKGRSTIPEAQRLHMLARHLVERRTREDMAKATEYLEQAVALDPQFALAWADLGEAYTSQAGSGWVNLAEGYRRSRSAVERALAAEPGLAEAYVQRAWVQMFQDRDPASAEQSLRRALELAPGNALAMRRLGMLEQSRGRSEEAIDQFRRSLEQDPLSSPTWFDLGYTMYGAGRFAEAEAAQRRALEISPQRICVHSHLGQILLAQGRHDEALAAARLETDESFRLWGLALVHHGRGEAAASDEALRELIEKYSGDAAFQVAEVHAGRGEVDAAFAWLERAHEQADPGLGEILASTPLQSLHGDPRWAEIVRKAGLGA